MGPVRSIGEGAFGYSDLLVEVGFAQPKVLERIERLAFNWNGNLVSINLPQNANIHKSAFFLCSKLKEQGCPYCKR